MPRIHIDNPDDPRLEIFRNLKTTNETRRENLFIVEGTTLVERLFSSEFHVRAVLASEQKLRNFKSRIPRDALVYEVPRNLATDLVGYKFHLGVVAAAERQQPPALSTLLSRAASGLVLFCDHVIDPQNVGMIIRVASAFGAAGVVLSRGSADAFSRRVLRVSMGNGLFLPIVEDVVAENAIGVLQSEGYTCCAAVLDSDAAELSTFAFPERSVIVFGNETHGIKASVTAQCDHRLTISMLNGTDSVNVAVAAGIFGYAFRSQHPRHER